MHATHVIIRGQVFTYAEKAPFVPAGESVLGALECDEFTGHVKCHECGTWIGGLGNHIKAHGLKRREYNLRFGLRERAPLSSMAIREKHRSLATRAHRKGGNLHCVQPELNVAAIIAANKRRNGPSGELNNEHAKCLAQCLFRLQTMAAELGHTPTDAERSKVGIGSSVLIARFGSVDRAMRIAGLIPNREGNMSVNPIPEGFPSKDEIRKKWDAPMPWPKDYFEVGHIALEQRRV